MRIERKGGTWGFWLMAGLCLPILVFSDEWAGRVFGALGVLFFGGGGLAFVAITRQRDPVADRELLARVREGPVNGATGLLDEPAATGVELSASRTGFVPFVAGCAIFVISSTLLLLVPERIFPAWIAPLQVPAGVLALVVFGLLLIGAVRGLVRGAGLAFLPDGILSVQPIGRAFVPWEGLADVTESRYDAPGQVVHHILLTTSDAAHGEGDSVPASPSGARFTGAIRMLRRLNRGWYGFDVSIGHALPLDNGAVIDLARRFADDPDLRRKLGEPGAAKLVVQMATRGRA